MSGRFEYFGKYLLLEKLATGGMAEVFLARAQAAGGISKFVAVKRILPQYADSREFIDMFKDEAKIAINLNHNNIVSIYDFGVQNDQFYLVMDYVEGRNLRQILNKLKKTNQKLSFDQIIYLAKEVASGLDHAHRCLDGSTGKPLNITHRDMSPQNVMVSFEGEVKIVDFGIAKAESQMETTRAGTLKGKFGYMSPEQAEGQPVDLRTDIFSLGIVLWELLANDRLFIANNEVNTLRKIRDCQIPSLRKLNPNIPGELERITQKALARDRNLRYQTAAAMHRDLNRFLNRQYPEFSPQDFATFIKNIFSEEIFGTRRRLVEYSKMSTPEEGKINLHQAQAPSQSGINIEDLSDSYIRKDDSSLGSSPSGVAQVADASSSSFSEQVTIASPSSTRSTDNILSDSALHREMNKRVPFGIADRQRPQIQRAVGLLRKSGLYDRPRSGGLQTLYIIAGLTLVIGIYVFLAKTQPESMAPIISKTDPYLKPIHTLFNISGQISEASTSPTPPLVAQPLPPPLNPNLPPLPSDPSQSPEEPYPLGPDEPAVSIIVTSDPSGAEIILNGKATGESTPAKVRVPSTRPYYLLIRRSGFIDYRSPLLSPQKVQDKFSATLQPALVGYLDIDVIPPQNVRVYINDQLLKEKTLPIFNYAVPAGVNISVRATNPISEVSETRTVQVPKDTRVQVHIDLRKSRSRQPSNQNH